MKLLVKSYRGTTLGQREVQPLFTEREKEFSNSVIMKVPIKVEGTARRVELQRNGKAFFTGKLKRPVSCKKGDTIQFNKGVLVLLGLTL